MKASDLKKDKTTSIRISEELFLKLQEKGMSPQMIIDNFVDQFFEVELDITIKD